MFASLYPITAQEFVNARQVGLKPELKFEIYAEEYADQEEVIFNDRRLSIYRVYGPKDDGKLELYTEGRVGNVNKR
ncbi:hypothetical protein LJC51_08960 [Lachnospiraceae bacterium OttesenSCG-928-J05]|nr:hypothetical protein [Lachnospiraceae bacterium OttesenSCG-928-J05]